MSLGDIGAGAELGPYELLVPIARGGMAMIWAARVSDIPGLDTLVAIKTLLPALTDDPEFEEMFRTEAELASQIRHPHVAEILDVGEQDGVLYIAMEWVEGEAVSTILKAAGKGGLPFGIAMRIAIDAAVGLHAAHELRRDGAVVGLVHRDVSPQNILVSSAGTVKIVDFGVAKTTIRAQQAETSVGRTKGKVPFMAPEQAEGKPVDRRVDVFALGVCLYQMVTGKHPFRSDSDLETLRRILDPNPATPPIALAPSCPPALDAAIVRAIAKDREQRFPTMLELSEALDAALQGLKREDRAGTSEVAAYLMGILGDRAEKRHAAIAQAIRATDERLSERAPRPAPASLPPADPPSGIVRAATKVVAPEQPAVKMKEPVAPPLAPPPAPTMPSRLLADLGHVYREADEPLAIGVRLRIALDLLESIDDSPLTKRTATSRMRVERVRLDEEGIGSVDGKGDATGVAFLTWEILAGRASSQDPPPPIAEVAEDVPSAVDDVLREALTAKTIASTSVLRERLEEASRGFADATADVREAIAKWLRDMPEPAAEKAPAPTPTAPAKRVEPAPAAKAPAPVAAPVPVKAEAKPAPIPAPEPPAAPIVAPAKAETPPLAKPAPAVKAATPAAKAPAPAAKIEPAKASVVEPIKAEAPAIEAPAKIEAPTIDAPPKVEASPKIEAAVKVEAAAKFQAAVKVETAAKIEAAPKVETPAKAAAAKIEEAPTADETPAAKAEIASAETTPSPAKTAAAKPSVRDAKRAPVQAQPKEKRPVAAPVAPKAPTPIAAKAEVVAPVAPKAFKIPAPPPLTGSIADYWSDDEAPLSVEPEPPSAPIKKDPPSAEVDEAPTSMDFEEAPPSAPPVAAKAPPPPLKSFADPVVKPAPVAVSIPKRVSVKPAPASKAPPSGKQGARRSVRPPAPVQAAVPHDSAADDEAIAAAQKSASRRRLVVGIATVGAIALTVLIGVMVSSSGDGAASPDAGTESPAIPPLRERMRPQPVAAPTTTVSDVPASAVPTAPSAAVPIPTPSSASAAIPSASTRAPSPSASAPFRPKLPSSGSAKPFLPEHL